MGICRCEPQQETGKQNEDHLAAMAGGNAIRVYCAIFSARPCYWPDLIRMQPRATILRRGCGEILLPVERVLSAWHGSLRSFSNRLPCSKWGSDTNTVARFKRQKHWLWCAKNLATDQREENADSLRGFG